MATWRELSEDNREAAQHLLEIEQIRRRISRSYYAAYCAVTDLLVSRSIQFPHGWNNPAHEHLPALVSNNSGLPRTTRFEINKVLRRLGRYRESADYRPRAILTLSDAVEALRDASYIIKTLEQFK